MIKNYMPCHGQNYGIGRTQAIKYLVIHYTANDGDTAQGNANYFNRRVTQTSAHYFVDEQDTIWQSVKEQDTAWHCGAKSYKHPHCRNQNSIGIELCSRRDAVGGYYFKKQTILNAAELARELMEKYSISIDRVIRHYDVTGKICPAPFVNDERQWAEFKKMLNKEEEIEDMKRYNTVKEIPEWGKATVERLLENQYLSGEDTGLNLSEDMLRILVINDRAGLYI